MKINPVKGTAASFTEARVTSYDTASRYRRIMWLPLTKQVVETGVICRYLL